MMRLIIFDTQTHSALTLEELHTLHKLLGALLHGILEARRAVTGAAAAPFLEAREALPPLYAKLLRAVETKAFKVRCPLMAVDGHNGR